MIVLTSLVKAIAEPSLVVSSFGRAQVPAPEPEMSAIGRLMNEAGQHPDDQAVLLKVAEGLLGQARLGLPANLLLARAGLNDENARALHLIGVINHQQGEHQKAAEFLEKSVAREENPGARYSLGVFYTHFWATGKKASKISGKASLLPTSLPASGRLLTQELAKAAK